MLGLSFEINPTKFNKYYQTIAINRVDLDKLKEPDFLSFETSFANILNLNCVNSKLKEVLGKVYWLIAITFEQKIQQK